MSTVFIIDHDQPQLPALHQALAQQGHQVVFAEESGDWLSQARTLRPACIVLAVELVGISGYSVCNKIKRDRELSAVPLVLASSQASAETFAEHSRLRTHADAYAHKPYDVAAIAHTVAGMVASARDVASAAASANAATATSAHANQETAAAPQREPEGAHPAAPAPAVRRAARFGEEPSVVDVSADPFLRENARDAGDGMTASLTRPAAAPAASSWGEPVALETSDAGQPSGGAGARSAAAGPQPMVAQHSANTRVDTDARILLERAVDTQTQTRIYDNLLPSQAELPKGQSPAELINAALGDLDAAAEKEAQLAQAHPAPQQVDADARLAQAEAERDRALAERDELALVLTQLRQLLGAAQH